MASPGQQPQHGRCQRSPSPASPPSRRSSSNSTSSPSLLERRPDFVEALKAHAKNLALARRHREGLQCDRRITRLRPQDCLARYNLACSLALTRQRDEALLELRRAVELGYRDFTFMKQDRDLDPIRKDPRFRALMREYDRKR